MQSSAGRSLARTRRTWPRKPPSRDHSSWQRRLGKFAAVAIVATVLVAGGLVTFAAVGSAPAAAQECAYPFDECMTRPPPPGAVVAPGAGDSPRADPTLVLGGTVFAPGDEFSASACGYDAGAAVTYTFGGVAAAAMNARTDGCAPGMLTVPAVADGRHVVCATALGYPPVCQTVTVAGATAQRSGGGATGAAGRLFGAAAGPFARTGTDLAALLVAAASAILLGSALQYRRQSRSQAR